MGVVVVARGVLAGALVGAANEKDRRLVEDRLDAIAVTSEEGEEAVFEKGDLATCEDVKDALEMSNEGIERAEDDARSKASLAVQELRTPDSRSGLP